MAFALGTVVTAVGAICVIVVVRQRRRWHDAVAHAVDFEAREEGVQVRGHDLEERALLRPSPLPLRFDPHAGSVRGVGAAVGAPTLGNSAFAIRLGNGLANASALLFFDFAPASIPVGPCTVAIAALTIEMAGTTDAAGVFQQPVPLPSAPTFLGLEAFGQGVVLDSNGLLLGGLGSLSNGLHLRVGQ